MEAAQSPGSQPIRILLADDHRLFAEALAAILEGDARLEIVGRARNGQEAIELARSLVPDVVVMDANMPVMDGVEATEEITRALPNVRVLMLTAQKLTADIDRAHRAGAAGYVTKDRVASELIEAIVDLGVP